MHEALKNYMIAINTCDLHEFIKYLNENIVFYYGNETIVGLEEIKKCFEEGADAIKDEKYWATDINYLHTDPKTLVCTYNFNYSGYVDGDFVKGSGRASNIFIKNEITNNWELIHEYRDKYSF